MQRKGKKINIDLPWAPFALLFSVCLLLSVSIDGTRENLWSGELLLLFVAFVVGIWALRKYIPLNWFTILIGIGFILRVAYILYTPVWCRQHDVIDFGTGIGHAGLIEYLMEYKALPDFDPREKWAFFQPPLHHIIAAIWIKVNIKLGILYRQAQENVQILTLFYTSTAMILSYYIFKECGLKKWGLRIACTIIAFSPIFIMMSGSLNNDALCLVLQVVSVYLVIKWDKEPRMFTIILLAIAIGCSMMAKLSGGTVAPAVAILFVLKLLKAEGNINESYGVHNLWGNIKKYWTQFFVFVMICFPLGLWSPLRNKLLFDVPFNYTPAVGEGLSQYTILQRLFDFQMHSVYPAMINYGDTYDEYNVLLALFKTSLFGEYNFSSINNSLSPIAVLFFIVGVTLAVISFCATWYFIIKKESPLSHKWKLFWGILYGTQLITYFVFAFKQTYFSSQDFRYIALSLVPQSLFLGMLADQLGQKAEGVKIGKQRYPFLILLICTIVFALCSCFIYIGIGFPIQ